MWLIVPVAVLGTSYVLTYLVFTATQRVMHPVYLIVHREVKQLVQNYTDGEPEFEPMEKDSIPPIMHYLSVQKILIQ